MKKKLSLLGVAMLSGSSAFAAGLDRSGQSVAPLFEDGRYFEFSLGLVFPDVSGNDLAGFGGSPTGNVINDYFPYGLAYKADLGPQLSYAVILDQPYGADLLYPLGGSFMFGGTLAEANTMALTGLMRYRASDRVSFHGGLRLQSIDANVTLQGAGYGPLAGYTAQFDKNYGIGYVIGAAYEIPDIALRFALTYNSSITQDTPTTELGALNSTTEIVTPQSVNFDFQTGVAADTLLFGTVRWVDWSEFVVAPAFFEANAGQPLVSYPGDYVTTTLGLGRQFTESWAGALTLGYEAALGGIQSPLNPIDGYWSLGGGVTYSSGNMTVTAGVRLVMPDATTLGVNDTAMTVLDDGMVSAIGFKIGYSL